VGGGDLLARELGSTLSEMFVEVESGPGEPDER